MAARRDLDSVLADLPLAYPGPGGAAAVLRNGQVIARQSWGFADLANRTVFTPRTLFRVCSISKQFTCAVALAATRSLSDLDPHIRAALPKLGDRAPAAWHLAQNQSGLRDYWAVAMLCGSPVEGVFDDAAARRLLGKTASLQFQPGSRYSYCNQNFRLLGEAVAAQTGHDFADLLDDHVFSPAGMITARLHPDTSAMPDGAQGYEGSVEFGFFSAVNRMLWTGDAGVIASLDDMIAWERFIDATRSDEFGLYRRMSVPIGFSDSNPARYGYGLARFEVAGMAATGHGGALRGWRSFRCYVPQARLSVVVMFNHSQDARAAAMAVAQAAIDPAGSATPPPTHPAMASSWRGAFIEPETDLLFRLEPNGEGRVVLHFGQSAETLAPYPNSMLIGPQTVVELHGENAIVRRAGDNIASHLRPMPQDESGRRDGLPGLYRNAEYDAEFTCVEAGGAVYGAFSGDLGQGEMQILLPVLNNIWRLPMPRALDCAPPGDWTLEFRRDGEGHVVAVDIGCWLARRLVFERVA
jgi:D-aminopeptidase